MTSTPQPLLMAIAGASVLTLGGMAWIGRDLLAGQGPGSPESLLELLDGENRPAQRAQPAARPAPPPPQPQTWQSPLAQRSCPAVDPGLQMRLAQVQGRLN
ncbi:MAG: N-acetylmuramoyl-L-alanine amidase, partial [Prochlorococcaceae cyanobacterium]